MKNRIIASVRSLMITSVLLLLCLSSFASTYYFSSSLGDDSRSSVDAQNGTTPWKSLAKLNAIFSQFNPGDSVLFKNGDVFYGSINIIKSGSGTSSITFSNYGTGAKPEITGFTNVSGWSNGGGNIWETNISAAQQNINSVIVDGVFQRIGRYPNTNNGYLTIQSAVGNVSITDPLLTSMPNWTGGEVVIRKAHWVVDRNTITSHVGNKITYNSQSGYGANAGYGYFIQNHPKTLDQDGEWYFQTTGKKFGIFSTVNPTGKSIRASTVQMLVSITNQSNISFNNLTFSGANGNAFDIKASQNIHIKNCDILYSGFNAVNAVNTNFLLVQNCTIYTTNNIACNINSSNNTTVKGCKISKTGATVGMGDGDSGSYEAILHDGDNVVIEANTIDSTGYVPVTFRGENVMIKNNVITNYAFVKDDGGGIYTWNNLSNPPVYTNRHIVGNIVLYGRGAGAGTPEPDKSYAHGIYMDDNAGGVEISGNTVAGCVTYGFYIHNAHDLQITNNTVYDNGVQLEMTHDDIAPYPIRNVVMTGNKFIAKQVNQQVAEFKTNGNDISSFGNFDYNYYARPLNDNFTIGVLHQENGSYQWKTYNLDQWKSTYGKDANSNKSPQSIFPLTTTNPDDLFRFLYNDEATTKTFPLAGTYVDMPNNTYVGSVNVTPYTSAVLLKKSSVTDTVSNVTCTATGSILREQWNNIAGTDISLVPQQTTPSSSSQLTSFESPSDFADNYAARIRGYICPPQTGVYTFWIAGDDATELWLSTDSIAVNKTKIAFSLSFTSSREWYKYASQKSAPIYLQAGRKYYIEALHKEGYGGDNLAVAWLLPNGIFQGPIPGSQLSPFSGTVPQLLNQTISFTALPARTYGDAPFTVTATASSGLAVSFRVVTGPATISGNTVSLTGTGNVTIEAFQSGNTQYNIAPSVSQSFIVNESASTALCMATGSILREQWSNIGGNDVSAIPLQTAPAVSSQLTNFEIPTNAADNYGTRIRGYICPPQTGNYIFWIAGDDATELSLSTDSIVANKTKIAYSLSWTSVREWNKFASQKSVAIYLQAGHRYYIEALHKEGGGEDNLAVAWQWPNGTFQAPVPGTQLSPFVVTSQLLAQTISFAALPAKTYGDAPFTINAAASSGLSVNFRVISGPATISGNTVTLTGTGTVTIEASQPGNTQYNAATAVLQSFVVTAQVITACAGAGSIIREQWNNVVGHDISSIPLQTPASNSLQLTSFESPTDYADNYGARIRGYICVPQTGNYTFWIAADDAAGLWLSTSDAVSGKVQIASVPYYTGVREWNKYASQKSATIYLQAGQRYYIEALHKEGDGGDHLAVAWQLPNGTFQAPIPGSQLSPYNATTSYTQSVQTSEALQLPTEKKEGNKTSLHVYPNPVHSTAVIDYEVKGHTTATIDLYDEHGRLIKKVFSQSRGGKTENKIPFNARGLASGVYIVRLVTQDEVISRKILIR